MVRFGRIYALWDPNQTFKESMSAFGGKADIVRGPSECLLMTQSGHPWASTKSRTD